MLKLFRIIGVLEGLSYLILLGVGMPLKYLRSDPSVVKAVGMPHGILFIAYICLALAFMSELNWPRKRFVQALIASLLPFGTFVFDYKYLKHGKGSPSASQ